MSVGALKDVWGDLRKLCKVVPNIPNKFSNDMHILFVQAVDDDEQSQVFIYKKSRPDEASLPIMEDVRSTESVFRHRRINDCSKVLSLGEMEKIDYSELELPLPDLISPSEILTEDHIKELYTLLPARAVGYPWTRVFSTAHDGFHLKTLYRKMTEFDSPVILVIQDTQEAVFGALLSYPLRCSDSFYGTGESFLFTFHPAFKVFKWTGNNDYFVKGDTESVSIGASEGHFGLWIDGDLYRGSSLQCQTYDNDPLAPSNDFIIKTLEAWGFA
ncbi:hypothetical protein JTE90_028466 [Oedothorax gibbosus]|uniref:Oxidation resistance protein 1 n=1 Tax=Oedothorax gibbosus TaxID=931172 RepID=A0AAV6VFQ0_9ARAC|nr:hypothetical protein JTE90_028466 [Oedothorax gibbosus]